MPKNFVAFFEFQIDLKFMRSGLEVHAIRYIRQVKQADARGPRALIPLCRGTDRITPGVGRIIEGPRIYRGPVQEVIAWVVRVLIGVKDVRDAELADREYPAVGTAISGQLVCPCLNRFAIAVQVECFAYEKALQSQVGLILADLVGFATRKAGEAKRVVQAKPLIDFRIDPNLRA